MIGKPVQPHPRQEIQVLCISMVIANLQSTLSKQETQAKGACPSFLQPRDADLRPRSTSACFPLGSLQVRLRNKEFGSSPACDGLEVLPPTHRGQSCYHFLPQTALERRKKGREEKTNMKKPREETCTLSERDLKT